MEMLGVVDQRLRDAGIRSRRFSVEVDEDAQVLYNEKPRPGWREMADRLAEMHPDRSPTEGALRQWQKKGIIREEREDEPWTFGEMTPEDDALVMAAVRPSFFRKTWQAVGEDAAASDWRPSRRGARWAVHIQRAAPALDDMSVVAGLARVASQVSASPTRSRPSSYAGPGMTPKQMTGCISRRAQATCRRSFAIGCWRPSTRRSWQRRMRRATVAGSGGQVRQKEARPVGGPLLRRREAALRLCADHEGGPGQTASGLEQRRRRNEAHTSAPYPWRVPR